MAPIPVFVSGCSEQSKYVPLSFTGITDRYSPRLGRHGWIHQATEHLRGGHDALLHIQWEDAIVRTCRSNDEANVAVDQFRRNLEIFSNGGGRSVLTIHNGWPHRHGYRRQFRQARQAAADASSAILFHNSASVEFFRQQIIADRSKFRLFPHPSYFGAYEPCDTTAEGLTVEPTRTVLCFGEVRRQKGFNEAIAMLPAPFLAEHGAVLRISGKGDDADALRDTYLDRSDIIWDIRYVPDGEALPLIRSAACVVLPYKEFLTSGIAHLVVSSPGILIGPDVSQHRELLPPQNHRFLYGPHDPEDFRRAVLTALDLPPAERRSAIRANYERAIVLRPELAGRLLADIYDEVLAPR